MLQLVYASRPFGFDSATLAGILLTARRNNLREGITGALICRSDLYLQLLEGPDAAVEQAYSHIRRDDRHIEVTELLRRQVVDRMFPNWAMRDDPARSWLWTPEEVHDGAIARSSPEDILAVFALVGQEDDPKPQS